MTAMYAGKEQVGRAQVIIIRHALLFYAKTGRKVNTAYTPKHMLDFVFKTTSKKFTGKSKYEEAAQALQDWLEPKFPTMPIEQLARMRLSKGELFAPLKDAGISFDYALPTDAVVDIVSFIKTKQMGEKHDWVDDEYSVRQWFVSTTVMVYTQEGEGRHGKLITCCTEMAEYLHLYFFHRSDGNYKWENNIGEGGF